MFVKRFCLSLLSILTVTTILCLAANADNLVLKKLPVPNSVKLDYDPDGEPYTSINNVKYYSAKYTPEFISNFKKCQRYQQSDYGGYMVYQILGRDSNNRCILRTMGNSAMIGDRKAEWIVQSICSLDQTQVNEFAKSMVNTRADRKFRSYNPKEGVGFNGKLSYYEYLTQYFFIAGFCKRPD